jgi:hypothetical protein
MYGQRIQYLSERKRAGHALQEGCSVLDIGLLTSVSLPHFYRMDGITEEVLQTFTGPINIWHVFHAMLRNVPSRPSSMEWHSVASF